MWESLLIALGAGGAIVLGLAVMQRLELRSVFRRRRPPADR